jgi:short-subunit dehydrogenase
MNLQSAVVLLTGASGGIGSATAQALLKRGARVLMTGRDSAKLNQLRLKFGVASDRLDAVAVDLQAEADRNRLAERAANWNGGVNVLINNAGTGELKLFDGHTAEDVAALVNINLLAPLQLTRALLPHLRTLSNAHILNVGSVYGAIGYPGYAVYSATKFGLRGFSEALRRELDDTNIRVHYLAPRATRTPMNNAAVDALNIALHIAVDSPERVALSVCRMLEQAERERVIGWPEQLFVRINALLPALVDRNLRKQLPVIRKYAEAAHEPSARITESTRITRNSA